MSETVTTPGEAIRAEMEERGWTQIDLANIMGRTIPWVNDVITGKRHINPRTAALNSVPHSEIQPSGG